MYLNEINPISFAGIPLYVGTPTATTVLALYQAQNPNVVSEMFPVASCHTTPKLTNGGTGPFVRQVMSTNGGTLVCDTLFAQNVTISIPPFGKLEVLISRLYVGGTVTDLQLVA